jgi:hypothetical protein
LLPHKTRVRIVVSANVPIRFVASASGRLRTDGTGPRVLPWIPRQIPAAVLAVSTSLRGGGCPGTDGAAGRDGVGGGRRAPHGSAVQEEQPRRAGACLRAAGVDPHRAAPRQRRLLLPHRQVRRLLRPGAAVRALLPPRRRQPLRDPGRRRAAARRAVRRARRRGLAPRVLPRAPPARGRRGHVRGLRRGGRAREGDAVVDGAERARRPRPRLRLLRGRAGERLLLAALLASQAASAACIGLEPQGRARS